MYFILTDKNGCYHYNEFNFIKRQNLIIKLDSGKYSHLDKIFRIYNTRTFHCHDITGNFYIRRVIIPADADADRTIYNYIVSDKIIVSDDIYSLFDKNTIIKHKLNNIIRSIYLIEAASNGTVKILEWIYSLGLMQDLMVNCMISSIHPICLASRYGRFNVLEWFKNSGLLESTYKDAILFAKRNPGIIPWWKDKENPVLNYSELSISEASHMACESGDTSVLEWWKNSGLPLKYPDTLLTDLDKSKMTYSTNILLWLIDSGLPFKYSLKLGLKISLYKLSKKIKNYCIKN
jgi:hypothetical protein